MNGELWKLKDDTHKTASSKAWLWSFAGVVGGLLMGAVGYRFLVLKKPTAETPPIPAPAPAAVYEPGRQQGLKLFESVIFLHGLDRVTVLLQRRDAERGGFRAAQSVVMIGVPV
jgi:hypothetical protein